MHHPQPPLTGTYHNKNYVWAIAMNLAWNELVTGQLGGDAKVETDNQEARTLVDLFNTGVFNRDLLEKAAYFVRSGIGPEELEKARADLKREKNIAHSLLDLITLLAGELFSYGRVEKSLQWNTQFERCVGIFRDQKVIAFQPARGAARDADVLRYEDVDPAKTVVRLKTKDGKDEVYLMSGYVPGREAEMVDLVRTEDWPNRSPLKGGDTLIIPSVHLKVSHDYPVMIGQQLLNPRLPDVFIAEMREEINFSMNDKGVEFVAEAAIYATRSMPPPPKWLIFDQPFLIVLKQTDQKLPYLVIGIDNDAAMRKKGPLFEVGRTMGI
jgi:hypothetical protein